MTKTKSQTLPLALLKVGRTGGLPIGSFAQVQEHPGADLLIGRCNEYRVAIGFELGKVWSKDAEDLSGPALWFPDVEFEVDPGTFTVFDNIEDKIGALAVQNGKIYVAVPPPSKAGYVLVQVGDADVTEGGVPYGFTNWKAVTRFGDETYVLMERPTG